MDVSFTIAWWWLPLALVIMAFIVPNIWPGESSGSYDFFTPVVSAAVFLLFIVAAIGVTIGYLIGG